MSQNPSVVDVNGQILHLESQIASGGEGAVYGIKSQQNLVAKVYHKLPSFQTHEKLKSMVQIANPALLSIAAWPKSLLYSQKNRELVGFVMPRLSDCHPIQSLYNPVQRLKSFSKASWQFQIRAAVNLAAAFEEVHKAGCLVGDINQSNVLVTHQALIKLIDCDSFQVTQKGKQFLCEVGVQHYTAPELQGKNFKGLVRSENHDRFGLAVLIYQLLFVGRHPYMGIYGGKDDLDFGKLIEQYRFSQGPNAHSWKMSPPPHTPTFVDIPPDVATLFRAAFERGSEQDKRPKPSDWHRVLNRLENSVKECASDAGHKFWNGGASCPWCRISSNGGPEYYFAVAGTMGTFDVDRTRLAEITKRLEQVSIHDYRLLKLDSTIATEVKALAIPESLLKLETAFKQQKAIVDAVVERQNQERRKLELEWKAKTDRMAAKVEKEASPILNRLNAEILEVNSRMGLAKSRDGSITIIFYCGISLALILLLCGFVYMPCLLFGFLLMVMSIIMYFLKKQIEESTPDFKRKTELERKKENVLAQSNNYMISIESKIQKYRNELLNKYGAEIKEKSELLNAYLRNLDLVLAKETQTVNERLKSAKDLSTELEVKWQEKLQSLNLQQMRAGIQSKISECWGLPAHYNNEINSLAKESEKTAKYRHLLLHTLDDAEIEGIGYGRKQTLASFKIFTAADIENWIVQGFKLTDIPGIGEGLECKLLNWRDQVLWQFKFDPKTSMTPDAYRVITTKYRNLQQQHIVSMNKDLQYMETIDHKLKSEFMLLQNQLKLIKNEHTQAAAQLKMWENYRKQVLGTV